jgi:BirA family transcriptional regulator, biotin operon repressor / biotin---[acetyl-CoA-carboxylase] ligase
MSADPFAKCIPGEHPLLAGYEFHDQIDSTNDLGLQLAADALLPCPYLIHAARQTRGRGRGSHAWWSDRGALTFSLIVCTSSLRIPPNQWPILSLATGLALADALGQYVDRQRIRVKWPNDVFLGERKVGGILIESARSAHQRFVIGIGLNINNSLHSAPSDVARRATSVRDEVERDHDLDHVLWNVLSGLSDHYRLLESGEYRLGERWRESCLLTGREVHVASGDHILRGECLGIDDRGALVVKTSAGVEPCFAGVVSWQGEKITETEKRYGRP